MSSHLRGLAVHLYTAYESKESVPAPWEYLSSWERAQWDAVAQAALTSPQVTALVDALESIKLHKYQFVCYGQDLSSEATVLQCYRAEDVERIIAKALSPFTANVKKVGGGDAN